MSMTFGIPIYDNTKGTAVTHSMRLTVCGQWLQRRVKMCIVIGDGDIKQVEGYIDYEDIKGALELL